MKDQSQVRHTTIAHVLALLRAMGRAVFCCCMSEFSSDFATTHNNDDNVCDVAHRTFACRSLSRPPSQGTDLQLSAGILTSPFPLKWVRVLRPANF